MEGQHRFSMEPLMACFETQREAAEFFEVDVRKIRERAGTEDGSRPGTGLDWLWADRLALKLKVHPADVWGDDWWEAALAEQGMTLFEQPVDAMPIPTSKHGWTEDTSQLVITGAAVPSMDEPPPTPGRPAAGGGNPFEARARGAKAAKLVAAARLLGVDAAALSADPTVRSQVVRQAGVRRPSDKTWAIVTEALALTATA